MSQRSSNEPCSSTSTLSDMGPSQILPFLYVGCQEDALSLKTMQNNQITHVINVSATGDRASFLNDNDDEHFLRIPINDCLNAQLSPYFEQAYNFIEKARLNNGRVLIHCLAGISRSPALAIAYIIRYLQLSMDDAYGYVKQCRPKISPNFNFLGQLYEYERHLKSTSTTTPLVKWAKIESPVIDRRHCVQVESRSHTDNSIKHGTNAITRPTCFNFDSINTRRPQTLLAPSSTTNTQLPVVESPQQQSTFLTSKISRPNEVTIVRSKSTDECPTIPLINSSYDDAKNKKRVELVTRSAHISSCSEQSDLINTYFQEARISSKSLEQWRSPQSFDSNNDTLTNNVLSSSLEVLVL